MQFREHLKFELSEIPLSELDSLAKKIADELRNHSFFCLWLIGDIGAGKTTLTGNILRNMGLDSKIAVTSPTFTYLSDYKINKKNYAHLDFYRVDSSRHTFSDLLSYCDFDGLFVEWPENLGTDLSAIAPTHILRIEKSEDLQSRNYLLYEASSV